MKAFWWFWPACYLLLWDRKNLRERFTELESHCCDRGGRACLNRIFCVVCRWGSNDIFLREGRTRETGISNPPKGTLERMGRRSSNRWFIPDFVWRSWFTTASCVLSYLWLRVFYLYELVLAASRVLSYLRLRVLYFTCALYCTCGVVVSFYLQFRGSCCSVVVLLASWFQLYPMALMGWSNISTLVRPVLFVLLRGCGFDCFVVTWYFLLRYLAGVLLHALVSMLMMFLFFHAWVCFRSINSVIHPCGPDHGLIHTSYFWSLSRMSSKKDPISKNV